MLGQQLTSVIAMVSLVRNCSFSHPSTCPSRQSLVPFHLGSLPNRLHRTSLDPLLGRHLPSLALTALFRDTVLFRLLLHRASLQPAPICSVVVVADMFLLADILLPVSVPCRIWKCDLSVCSCSMNVILCSNLPI
mmetsp:Transcript_61048/g.125951  ORF Transcript_61048/g.125951 Transcript_61048/m.125951 type:complete len:135 (+) Transcript_61048:2123-2527(+)